MIKQNGLDTLEQAMREAVRALPKFLPCPEDGCEAGVPAESVEVNVSLNDRRLTITTVQEIGSHPHEDVDVVTNMRGEEVGRFPRAEGTLVTPADGRSCSVTWPGPCSLDNGMVHRCEVTHWDHAPSDRHYCRCSATNDGVEGAGIG